MLTEALEAELLAVATTSRLNAYAPYSHFLVGAAVLGESGRIYGGCNVENASFSHTCCAEQVAVFQAIHSGERAVKAVLVLTETEPPASPCGACRQVIHEFGPEADVLLANQHGIVARHNMAALLPDSFGPESLRRAQR